MRASRGLEPGSCLPAGLLRLTRRASCEASSGVGRMRAAVEVLRPLARAAAGWPTWLRVGLDVLGCGMGRACEQL